MNKDVKSSAASLLSPKVQRVATAPIARVSTIEDYVVIGGKKTSLPPQTGGKTPESDTRAGALMDGLLRPSEAPSGTCMEISQIRPVLAGMALQAAPAAEAELRRQLLLARSRGGKGSLANWKHYYTPCSNTSTAFATAEATYNLCQIVGGTAVNTRLTNTIRLHKLNLKMRIEQFPGAAAGTNYIPQVYHMVLWRDKIPSTPGTPPVLITTDTNPPSSPTAMFSRLGSTNVNSQDLLVVNPSTEIQFHIYKIWRIDPFVGTSMSATAVTGNQWPHVRIVDETFELHKVEQVYQSFTDTDSDVNNIYLTFFSNNNGSISTTNYNFVSDIEFEDVQL